MRALADSTILFGLSVLVLVIAATVSVGHLRHARGDGDQPLDHRGAASDRRQAIAFIAGQFQRHFLALGLKGGVIGGGAAMLILRWPRRSRACSSGTVGAEQFAALFGSISIGLAGYIVILMQILLIAAVAAATSRRTVSQTLASI